jgi:hypothetical protein
MVGAEWEVSGCKVGGGSSEQGALPQSPPHHGDFYGAFSPQESVSVGEGWGEACTVAAALEVSECKAVGGWNERSLHQLYLGR